MQFGSTINPALGRTDYSAYTQGAAQGAAQIGQGIQQLGAGIGAAIKEYGAKKEEKQLTEATKETLKALAIKNPKMAKQFGVTDINDDKMWNAGIKAVGPKGAWQFAQGMQQQADAQEKSERVDSLTNFLVKNKGELPEDIASNLKGDEVVAARNAYEMIRGERAKSSLAEAQAIAALAEKVKEPTQFGVAYKAFNDNIVNKYGREPNAEEVSDFTKQYQQQSHAPTIINTAENKGLGAAETEIGKEVGARYNAIAESANAAERKLELLNKVQSLYKSGAYTGTGAPLITKLSNIAVGMGIDVPSNASQNQIEQLLQEEALRSTREMYKGTGSISNLEGSKGEKTVANLSRTPEGNIQILKWQSANAPLLRAANDLKIKLRREKKEPEEIVDAVDNFIRKGYRKIDDFSESSIKKKGDESAVYDIVTGGKYSSPSTSQVIPSPNDIQAEIARRKAAKVK